MVFDHQTNVYLNKNHIFNEFAKTKLTHEKGKMELKKYKNAIVAKYNRMYLMMKCSINCKSKKAGNRNEMNIFCSVFFFLYYLYFRIALYM